MLIDCDQCAMRDTSACADCVVTFLIGNGPVDLTDNQSQAVGNLAAEGLVPRLRLIPVERILPQGEPREDESCLCPPDAEGPGVGNCLCPPEAKGPAFVPRSEARGEGSRRLAGG